MYNRRDFLKNASFLTAVSILSGGAYKAMGSSNANQQKKIIGLQTWSVRRELNQDIPSGMIFKKAYSFGLDEYFVELEGIRPDSGITQFEGVKKCIDYLNNASFVK